MANQDLKEDVLLNLRSVTQSCKGGVPFERLQRDYRDLLGSPIPFRELGYNSLEAFIRDIPDVISLRKNSDGHLVAQGVADDSTAHIVSLVSRQKTETKKRNFRKPPPFMGGMRKTLSSRYNFREGSHSSHSRYNSSPPSYVAKSSKPKSAKAHVAQHSKPPAIAQVSNRQYEIAPRFLRQNSGSKGTSLQSESTNASFTSDELISSPTNSSSYQFSSDFSIPPPKAYVRSIPNKPQSLKNSRAAQLEALESAKTAKEFITIYSEMNNLTVDYRTTLMGQKNKSKGYVSLLTVGKKTYRLYPEQKETPQLAEEEVAKKAMIDIKKSKEHLSMYPETPYRSEKEIRTLLDRIEEIVCEKPSGMFQNGVLKEYENKFNETLPACWLDLLKQSANVEVEELDVAYGTIPEGAKFIIHPVKELSSGNRTPSSTSSKTEYVYDDLDTRALKETLVKISSPKIPEFKIPNGNIWDLFITNVNGWFSARLLDYNDDFLSLSEEMSQFYKNRNSSEVEIFEYQLYAAYLDESPHIWHRVLVEEIKEDGQISCYFVDEGDFTCLKKENLQEMNPSFLKLPFQAIQISLDGLAEYENCIKYELLEKRILGKTLIAEVIRWHYVKDFFPDVSGIHRKVYSVVLYDTSDSSGEDLNLNEWLKQSVKESLICKLPKLSTTSCAYLSHVTADGLVYLRLTNPQRCLIEQELEKLSPNFEEASLTTEKIPVDTLCVAKYESGTWHRALVTENFQISNDPENIEVLFVDYGHFGMVAKNEICELKPNNELLASAPHQAICCELLNALPSPNSKWTEAATIKLMELAPFDEELIVRVMYEADENNVAKVNLYKRNEDSNIISINDSLSCNPSLFKDESASLPLKVPTMLPLQKYTRKSSLQSTLLNGIPDVAVPAEQMAQRLCSVASPEQIEWLNTPDNIKSPEAFELHSPTCLALPVIPEKGQYFDVFVTLAAHPHNFFVQPLDSCSELDKLMKDMLQFYSCEENLLEMDFSMLRKNEYYAALHTDNSWYRVRIINIIKDNLVLAAVDFVDFGDYNIVSISKLQPLYQQFKKLPCQAVMASVAGIKPYDKDWAAEHCVQFQEMVTEKTFVSIVHKKQLQTKDDIPNMKVDLLLIDTKDSSKDVYIHERLIEMKIAKPL